MVVIHYCKYFLFHVLGLFSAASLLAGGHYTSAGLLALVVFYVLGDALGGDDCSTPSLAHPGVLTAMLWLALPLLALIVFCGVWSASPGDVLGFGAWVGGWSGYDVLAARAGNGTGYFVSAVLQTGLMIGMVGTIPGHELTHRTRDPVSLFVGRWLLAFSFDTAFSIEHVYGHHRYVATLQDPASAPRGRNVYWHIVSSTVRGNISAWRIEARRLQRQGHAVLGWHNAFLRGQLMSATLLLLAWGLGGWPALAFLVLAGLWGKSLLEIVNYMEHYGLVRDPATPVQPRHSWNTNRRLSSWSMFNLTRHSHHHARAVVPFHELQPMHDAPRMLGGYLGTIMLAMVPPLWRYLMAPKLREWDRDYASDTERQLAAQAERRATGRV